jgi:hypothetical protein
MPVRDHPGFPRQITGFSEALSRRSHKGRIWDIDPADVRPTLCIHTVRMATYTGLDPDAAVVAIFVEKTMDPITTAIVAALPALGSDLIKSSVNHACAALKAIIRRRWGDTSPVAKSVDALEGTRNRKGKRKSSRNILLQSTPRGMLRSCRY